MSSVSDSSFAPQNFATTVAAVVSGGWSEMSDFFDEDRCLSFIEPYPEQSALHVFTTWLACRMLNEETNDADLEAAREAGKGERAGLLAVDEAFLLYGMKGDSFAAFLREAGKKPAEAVEDDVYDYVEGLLECGTLEELGFKIADKAFPILLADAGAVEDFNEAVAERIAAMKTADLEMEDALYFASDGRLHEAPMPPWVRKLVTKREAGKCARCAADLSVANRRTCFRLVVPASKGGINDVSNVHLLCERCGTLPA